MATMNSFLTRRRILGTFSAVAAGVLAVPTTALAAESGPRMRTQRGPYMLELFNTHTSETVAIAYRDASGFIADSLTQLDWLLRDHRAGVAAPMDPLLFDQLADLAAATGLDPRFEVISGYRSPQTNAQLADASEGVARHSLHMDGRAIDLRLRGLPSARLRDLALAAGRGGVGFYARSDFVHLDTGRVRNWAG